jgi:leucyl-tRNA synthetase
LRNMQLGGAKFRRQQFVGDYIVDFVSFDNKLIIEIDGGHHNEDNTREYDERRTEWLRNQGYRVIRSWNNDVLLNTESVLEQIKETLR